MARSTKRVDKLEERVGELPISPEVLETSMAQFHASGVLPEHPKLAELVIQRTLHTPRHRPLREQLLQEAVHEMPEVSKAAREVLKLLVAAGQDVTSRGFLDESMEPSEYGPLGWQLLGWPEILIREPYAEQAKRLLARLDKVRESAAYKDQRWFEDFAAQSATFFQSGALPDGGFVREATLVYGELLALARTLGGEEDPEVLAAFDEMVKSKGEAREESLNTLCELAADGRIP
jgi:hypothetical protein